MAVTGPTNVATWSEMQWDMGHDRRSMQGGRDAGAGGGGYPTHSGDDPREQPSGWKGSGSKGQDHDGGQECSLAGQKLIS